MVWAQHHGLSTWSRIAVFIKCWDAHGEGGTRLPCTAHAPTDQGGHPAGHPPPRLQIPTQAAATKDKINNPKVEAVKMPFFKQLKRYCRWDDSQNLEGRGRSKGIV